MSFILLNLCVEYFSVTGIAKKVLRNYSTNFKPFGIFVRSTHNVVISHEGQWVTKGENVVTQNKWGDGTCANLWLLLNWLAFSHCVQTSGYLCPVTIYGCLYLVQSSFLKLYVRIW